MIANRGEIAIRIARAAADLGLPAVAVYAQDDAASLHRQATEAAVALPASGARAYLDIDALTAAAKSEGCDAVHPGYGFLSESAAFARACAAAKLTFVGPAPESLDLFGDKAAARALAIREGVGVAPGTSAGASLDEVKAFQAGLGPAAEIMIKAVAGGGGRGMRRVGPGDDLARAYELCAGEAKAAFGDERLYAEALLTAVRHIEVQIAADGTDAAAIHDRDCSVQRARQKVIEIAPASGLAPRVRADLQAWSVKLAKAGGLKGLATFEYLVPLSGDGPGVFIEANPRLQVEHTVTEEVTGLDLVQLQLRLADGESLADCGLGDGPPPVRGHAIQLRINMEALRPDGTVASTAGGVLAAYEPASGPGVRVDGCGYGGYATSSNYDPLLAKLIVASPDPDFGRALARARRAAAEFRVEGVATNLPLLRAILDSEALAAPVDTTFVEAGLAGLLERAAAFEPAERATAQAATGAREAPAAPAGTAVAAAPLRGTLVAVQAAVGDLVRPGQVVAVMEAMKMQHEVTAPVGGVVQAVPTALGETVDEGWPLAFIAPGDHELEAVAAAEIDLDLIRPDLADVLARQALTLDENRPDSIARRRRTNQRMARENLDDLFDPGSFKEFGAFAIAAQRRRRSLDDLRANTPADGIVTGVGDVNGQPVAGLAYDFTVLAGTQGHFGHKKTDQILEYAEHWKLPMVWFTEGGGGRPGDVDVGGLSASSLDTTSFTTFARLSGLAPRIAINSGRCFAGNAVFFGCADICIATRYSNIGLGGPAMIEGGGLGVYTPDEIGPSDVLYANGTLDLLVEDEAAATAAAKHLLGIFQGPTGEWTCADQRTLRHLIPENRVKAYDVRPVIETLADTGSWIELRGGYGPGMITGFLRIEGRPMGVIANDPRWLGGAIDSEGAEKGGRFMQLCDAFGVPILSLCDTPGFMVGPQSEATAAVRRGSRLFVTAQSLSAPLFAVVLRKGYGLGAQAMTAGDFSAAAFTIAWPTAEFGPMGLEGAVRLGYRKELEAETDPVARQALFDKLLGRMYQVGKATSVAEVLEINAVIDPAETRSWLVRGLTSCPVPPVTGRRRRFVDTW
ncbi:carboxyl transferase domain-containing protein [Phenylobacterium sp.]|uniref:acetyl-CoA carboxylase family protein n=1 Tax=Phenylobacterium sp. TaxID=1871053 RepID=UPI00344D9384